MKFNQQWQARAIRPDGPSDWFPAEVPGNVQYDYGVYMNWGDINIADNVTKFRQTEDYTWEYKTTLAYDVKPGEKAVFVTEGIDYIYDILIDGEMKLSHEGMFTKVELDLAENAGSELTVRIHPHPKRATAEFEDRQQADQSVKPPVCYEWDWHPRMLVSGIWQDTYVETRDAGYIRRCEPFFTLNEDRSVADIHFEIDCDAPVTIELYDPDGNFVGSGDQYTISNPRLWWCNGQGAPDLYTYEAHTDSHKVSGHIGLKTVKLVMSEGAWIEPVNFPKGRSVAPIQLELNGRNVFGKGSNWVNPDIFNGRIDEARYEALITFAKEANMNIFRCWGGSGINKKAFYDICDRLGIMVWVEFPLACNNYVGTPHYLEILEQEATEILKNLRSHASIVLYCGGNELFNNWSLMTDQSLALRLLNKLCYEYDQFKPYIMTSPVFGMGHGNYTFYDPAQQKDVYQLFQSSNCTAYTEFGCSAIAEMDVLEKIIPADELFPIGKTKNWILHHAFKAWGEEPWVCMPALEMYAPGPLDSLEKIVNLSNWMQCEGYKAIFEEARRQAPYCTMAINWDYCEPWMTAAGNNLIAYPTKKKPCYYSIQSALRPVLASARIPRFDWKAGECFHAEMWLLNDSPEAAGKTVKASIKLGGETYPLLTWESGMTEKNKIGPTLNWILPDVDADDLTLILDTGDGASSEYRLRYRPSQEKEVSRQLNV